VTVLNEERLGIVLGAVVHGVDLRDPIDSALADCILDSLHQHQVLFFPDQNLNDEELLQLASAFGPLKVSQPGRFLGQSDPIIIHERAADSPPLTERWHTDVPFVESPPLLGILSAKVMPGLGGDTAWASTYALFDSLSGPMQSLCRELCGEHRLDKTVAYVRHQLGDEAAERVNEEFPLRLHRLAQEHPVTKRELIYLGATMSSIEGLTTSESDLILGYLRGGLDDINIQVRWRWTPGDIAIWDQRSTVHKGLLDRLGENDKRIVHSVFVD
jgi:taurine dioxygenase